MKSEFKRNGSSRFVSFLKKHRKYIFGIVITMAILFAVNKMIEDLYPDESDMKAVALDYLESKYELPREKWNLKWTMKGGSEYGGSYEQLIRYLCIQGEYAVEVELDTTYWFLGNRIKVKNSKKLR